LLVNQIIGYLESPGYNLAFGLGLSAAMFGSEMMRTLSFSALMIVGSQTGKDPHDLVVKIAATSQFQ
jgi:hypothetical protein